MNVRYYSNWGDGFDQVGPLKYHKLHNNINHCQFCLYKASLSRECAGIVIML